jgi:hypothetical protein
VTIANIGAGLGLTAMWDWPHAGLMNVTIMLREDRNEWDKLVSVLDAHPGEILHNPDSSWRWTSRDIYAHLARWINYSMNTFETILGRRPPSPPLEGTDDEINARWQQKDSALTLAEARSRASAAFDRRVHLIKSVSDDAWDKELEKVAHFDGADHYRHHRSYIVVE